MSSEPRLQWAPLTGLEQAGLEGSARAALAGSGIPSLWSRPPHPALNTCSGGSVGRPVRSGHHVAWKPLGLSQE